MDENGALFSKLGIPLFLTQRIDRFEQWLMHGVHPEDETMFDPDDIPAADRAVLLELLSAYLNAGFPDPGVGILRDSEWAILLRKK